VTSSVTAVEAAIKISVNDKILNKYLKKR